MSVIKDKMLKIIFLSATIILLSIVNVLDISTENLKFIVFLGILICLLGNYQLYLIKSMDEKLEINKLKCKVKDLENINEIFSRKIEKYNDELNSVIEKTNNSNYCRLQNELNDTNGCIDEYDLLDSIENYYVRAMIKNKYILASGENVDFRINIESDLIDINVTDVDLCTMLVNLIDNAIRHSKTVKDGYVDLKIVEDDLNYNISISNNGQVIPKEIRGSMFEVGVTSKEELGHGMGLYIIKNIVDRYNGTIEFSDKNGVIRFVIKIPK